MRSPETTLLSTSVNFDHTNCIETFTYIAVWCYKIVYAYLIFVTSSHVSGIIEPIHQKPASAATGLILQMHSDMHILLCQSFHLDMMSVTNRYTQSS